MDCGHIDTMEIKPQRKPRVNYSVEFKEQIVAACLQPHVSIASISRTHNLNANVVHRWVREFEFPMKLTSFKPYARIGLQVIKTGDTGDNTDGWHQYLQSKNVRPLVGLGLDLPVNEKLTFSFEWEQYGKTGSNDLSNVQTMPLQINPKAIYVSANYSFK